MNWIRAINQWRLLSAEEKLRRRWTAIPQDVAQSMAFEGEPVEIRELQETLNQITPPASSTLAKVSPGVPKQPRR